MARKIVSRGFDEIQKTQGLEDRQAHGTLASRQPSDRIGHLDGDTGTHGLGRQSVKQGIGRIGGDAGDHYRVAVEDLRLKRGAAGGEDKEPLKKPAAGPSSESSPEAAHGRGTSTDETADAGGDTDSKKVDSATTGESKKSASLSTIKIIASAAAAITASVITTKLAGYLNSFLIVGCSSMIIAVLSEVYSRTLKKMRRVSAKVMYGLPYDKVLPAAAVSSIDRSLEHAMEDTATIEAVSSTEADVGGSPRVDEPVDASSERDVEGQQDGEHDDVTPLRELQAKKGAVRGLMEWAIEEVRSFSWLTKAMIMIFGAALLSTGVNWMMVQAMEQPNVTNVTQQITKEEVQQLPDSEKQAIKQAAVDAAQQNTDSLGKKIDSISGSLAALTDRVSKLEADKTAGDGGQDAAQAGSGDAADASSASQADLDSLKTQIAELQSELASLKANSSSSTGAANGGNSQAAGSQSTPQ